MPDSTCQIPDTRAQWLEHTAARAEAHLATLPASAQPTWYRTHVAESRERATWTPAKRAVVEMFEDHPGVKLTFQEASALADAALDAA